MTLRTPTRVLRALLVADESPQREALLRVLQRDADIAVVGSATSADGLLRIIALVDPDVILLDLDLCDGTSLAALEGIMGESPRPVLGLSDATGNGAGRAVADAMTAGAVDVRPVPAEWTTQLGRELRHTVHQVSKVHVVRHVRGRRDGSSLGARPSGHRPVVAIAASTGGPSALAVLLAGLAGLDAPVLVVQHLHAEFTGGLLEWMSRASALPVQAARDQETARPGTVYLAPAGVHLRLGASGRLTLDRDPPAVHRPSADQLFTSLADRAGRAGVGVLLTGMGDDGARGLLALRRSGGRTLAQDRESCAVFGMPMAAQRAGAVSEMLPLDGLAAAIQRAVAEVAA